MDTCLDYVPLSSGIGDSVCVCVCLCIFICMVANVCVFFMSVCELKCVFAYVCVCVYVCVRPVFIFLQAQCL